jgi:probable rRNA maturation factor
VELTVLNNQEKVEYDHNLAMILDQAARIILANHNIGDLAENCLELTLVFVDDEEIKDLNAQYRGIDKKTDVLSFPQYASLAELKAKLEDAAGSAGKEGGRSREPVLLGDVVISLETAREQGEEYEHSFVREVGYLFIHGMLHLLGYDHLSGEEQAHMRQAEEAVLNQLSLVR